MGIENIRLFLKRRYSDEIRAHIENDERAGNYSDFPEALDSRITGFLKSENIESLYSHQTEAFDAISAGKDTLLVASTASGKTLSFFLPILNEYSKDGAPFSVLLLYPTKALSRDQESTFGRLLRAAGKGSVGTFDGDTPRDDRTRIQRSSDFIITNPDMLHSGILPSHNRKWRSFLSRLKYVVVDEVHTYRGSFGSHVSNVFRRLQRVCELHGSRPVFVCSSATIGNPAEHAGALFHREFTVIDNDGAGRSPREFFFINPPLEQSQGHALYRRGPASVSVPLLREAVKHSVRAICFCRSRQEVERLYRAVCDNKPDLAKKIKPYRGGLLPNERRALERDLQEGRLTAIITTNALELGIDIGDLDLCILSGHPGTVASFHQQSGRVGRRGNSAMVVYIAKDSPIDQYIVHHPGFVTETPVEEAWLSADNPYILLQHLPCAAHEYPLRKIEPLFPEPLYSEALEVLSEDSVVVPYNDAMRYALSDYPTRGVNLRGMTDYNIEIYCGTEVIGEIDPIGARGTLYKDAIYQHLGVRYMSMDLDLEKKLCRVEPVTVDYYTEAVWEGRVEMIDSEEKETHRGALLTFGLINVNRQPKLYKKIRERTFENIGYGPITLPPFEYDTTGFSFLPPPEWRKALESADKRHTGAALYGLSYLLRRAAPGLCMADVKDIQTDVSLTEVNEGQWESALYLYDSIEGGVGYAEKIYQRFVEALQLCRVIVKECECRRGCPSCVPPTPPGVDSEELLDFLIESDAAVACTKSLIEAVLEGTIIVPDIHVEKSPLSAAQEEPEDTEKKDRVRKLSRASSNLKKRRERLH